MAHALARRGARILVVERGDFVPPEPENWSPAAVWKDLRYRTDRALARRRRRRVPAVHALLRRRQHQVLGQRALPAAARGLRRDRALDGVSPAWPIDYDTLAPYYDAAERLYHVHGDARRDPTEPPRGPFPHPPVPHAPRWRRSSSSFARRACIPSPLPLGLHRPGEAGGCQLCNTCNSFPCRIHAKSDAEVCCVQPAARTPNVTLWTRRLRATAAHRRRRRRVSRRSRSSAPVETVRVEAPLVVVSCGAVNSAALLLRSAHDAHPRGLANSSGLVGRRYMAHLATMMQGFHPFRKNTTVFQKTVAINDFYLAGRARRIRSARSSRRAARTASWPRSSATRGSPGECLGAGWAYDAWVARGVDWLAMSEDLPHPDNRVTLDR